MNVILPIVAMSLIMGLLVRRMTMVHWLFLSVWIGLVIVVYYIRN